MNASLTFRHRYALHAMHARLPAHRSERAVAFHLEDGFLHSAKRAVRLRDHFNPPAPALGEARIHAVQVGGEYRCLVTAGAPAYFYNCGAVVEWIVWDESGLDLGQHFFERGLEPSFFRGCLGRHLGVVRTQKLAGFRELLLNSLDLRAHLD